MSKLNFIPSWAAVAVLAMGAVSAHAQPAPAAGQAPTTPVTQNAPAPRHAGKTVRHADPAKRAERHAQHWNELKQKLNLTSAQQSAWDHYQAAMRPASHATKTTQETRRAEREAWARLTTPERIDAREKRHAEMQAQRHARNEATKTFYHQLSPEQRQVFDAQTDHHRKGHKAHERGHVKPHKG